MIKKNIYIYELFEDGRRAAFYYQNVDGGTRIVSYAGSRSFVKIPEEINGMDVVEIGSSVFSYCDFNSIELPSTLTKIESSAFEYCKFTSVTIPKTVKHVGDSAFYGSKHIYVYDTLQSNAGEIGFSYSRELPHIITVLSADNDQIKFSVPMYTDGSGAHSRLLRSSWGPGATFNFRAFDNYFAKIKGAWIKLSIAISRLKNPVNLSDARRQTYVAYVVRNAKAVMKDFIDANDLDSFTFFESFGTIKKANIDELIEYAVNKQAVAFSAFLMNYKEKNFPSKVSTKRSLSLGSIRTVAPWRMTRNTIDTVDRYRGSDVDVIFPTEVRGNAISKIATATATVPDNYKEIVSLVIPEGYVSIGDNAFRGCENLERISLPSTLKKLGKCAFARCGKLQEVELPKGIKYIEEDCFYNSGLKIVIFHGCDPWISTSAFGRDVRFIGNKHIPGQRISDSWLGSYAKFIEINPKIEYEGKLFVFSGLGTGNARDHEIVQSVIRKGGLFRSTVSGKTDYLIVSPENAGITKIDAAIKQKKKGSSIKVIVLEDLVSDMAEK
ncbi:MAG: leucine-rich repeat protein [Fastidiosipila sp.]|nr:leucine-rich repeat protein [Fastidiosipila sp.]